MDWHAVLVVPAVFAVLMVYIAVKGPRRK